MSKKKMDQRPRINVSPSQIKTYEHKRGGCNRKWVFPKIDREPTVPSKWATFGTDTHVYFQNYYEKGVMPGKSDQSPHAKVFRMGIESGEYPDPEPGAFDVERRFEIKVGEIEIDGVTHDVYVWGDPDLGDPGVEDEPAFVWDNKTTGDFRWRLKDEQLAEDVHLLNHAPNVCRPAST